jgi:regulatory protein YycH of two-component signal transduction system YycFG
MLDKIKSILFQDNCIVTMNPQGDFNVYLITYTDSKYIITFPKRKKCRNYQYLDDYGKYV